MKLPGKTLSSSWVQVYELHIKGGRWDQGVVIRMDYQLLAGVKAYKDLGPLFNAFNLVSFSLPHHLPLVIL